jgi:hypothetical protein
MFIQSEKWPGSGSKPPVPAHDPPKCDAVWREDHALIQDLERGRTQNRVPLLLAALLEMLLDKAISAVQKLCKRIIGLPQHTRVVD